MTCPEAARLGVFALGAQDGQRAEVERHLAGCAACRAELAELAEVPVLLGMVRSAGVDVDGGSAAPPPEDLLDRTLSRIGREQSATRRVRHGRRRLVGLVAAAVLAAAGAGIGVAVAVRPIGGGGGEPAAGIRIGADTTLASEPWGTRIAMTVSGLTPGTSCRLVARARDGRTETAASWRVTYQNALEVDGMTSFRPDELAELEVVDESGRRLVTMPVGPTEGRPR